MQENRNLGGFLRCLQHLQLLEQEVADIIWRCMASGKDAVRWVWAHWFIVSNRLYTSFFVSSFHDFA